MDLSTKFTVRYLTALLLIACVMAFSYLTIVKQISLNDEDAHIINVSGMQRMLSQRIALLSNQIVASKDKVEAARYLPELNKVITRMESNYVELSARQGSLSPALQNIYFSEGGIEEKLMSYVALARNFMDSYAKAEIVGVKQNEIVRLINSVANDGILVALDSAVSQHEAEANQKIAHFKKLETIFLSIGFAALMLEIIFIFRPMVNSAVKTVDELELSNAELTEFSYRISHDLRAPIVSSRGLAELSLLLIGKKDYDGVNRALGHITQSMSNLETLIDDIINLTKTKLAEIESEDVKLDALVDDAVKGIKNIEGHDKVEIIKNIEVDHPIRTKKMLLSQVIFGLVSNAIKYADVLESKPFVEIEARIENGICMICMSDNGLGIPEDHQNRVFGMFQRFHPRVSFGSGLGLYLIKQNVRRLGGDISYTPLEKGSMFKIELPLHR